MTMADKADKTAFDEAELDRFFAAGRAEAPVPSDALLARILADADARAVPAAPRPPASRSGWFAELLAGIGGWPAAAGIAAAAMTGVTIGMATPEMLDSLSGGYLSVGGTQADDLLPSYAALLGEG